MYEKDIEMVLSGASAEIIHVHVNSSSPCDPCSAMLPDDVNPVPVYRLLFEHWPVLDDGLSTIMTIGKGFTLPRGMPYPGLHTHGVCVPPSDPVDPGLHTHAANSVL